MDDIYRTQKAQTRQTAAETVHKRPGWQPMQQHINHFATTNYGNNRRQHGQKISPRIFGRLKSLEVMH